MEAKHAAASLWMQLGWLYAKQQQPPSAESDTPAVAANPDKAVQCFQQAALACQPFGERNLSMELSTVRGSAVHMLCGTCWQQHLQVLLHLLVRNEPWFDY